MKDLAQALNYLFKEARACATARACLVSLRRWVDQRCVAALGDAAEDSVAQSAAAMVSTGRVSYGSKRLRIDEDLKNAAAVQLLNSKDIKNTNSFLRATGASSSVSTGRLWQTNHVLRSQAAALDSFEGISHVRVATDGSRIGKPAEETNVYILSDRVTGFKFPMAPQDHKNQAVKYIQTFK